MNTKLHSLICTCLYLLLCNANAENLRHDFANPPLEYATRPLWFWNDTVVSKEGIVEQMQEARDRCGYGGSLGGSKSAAGAGAIVQHLMLV